MVGTLRLEGGEGGVWLGGIDPLTLDLPVPLSPMQTSLAM